MQIVTIPREDFQKLENSDRLYITKVEGLPCIIGVDVINEIDYLYIPLDTVISPLLYALLNRKDEYTVKRARIKACRLRGVFSEGLLLPLSKVEEIFPNIESSGNILTTTGSFIYRDLEDIEDKDKVLKEGKTISWWQKVLNWFKPKISLPEYCDTQRVEKVNVKEGVYIPTVKIHGTSTRYSLSPKFLWFRRKLVVGSRRVVNPKNNLYYEMAVKYGIEEELLRLSKFISNPVIVGEIAGEGVQKGFPYEHEKKLYVYGLYGDKQWYGYEQLATLISPKIPIVPCVGDYINTAVMNKEGLIKQLELLCDTKTYPSIDNYCKCREGVVLQLISNEESRSISKRSVFKYISQSYRSK